MRQLSNILSNDQVNGLAEAGKVEFRKLANDSEFFAIINGDLYKKGNSYHILKREFLKYEKKIKLKREY